MDTTVAKPLNGSLQNVVTIQGGFHENVTKRDGGGLSWTWRHA